MDRGKLATNFAPYTPPPDDPSVLRQEPSTFSRGKLPWFSQSSSQANLSYQSGGIPTFNDHVTAMGSEEEAAAIPSQMWETRTGWRVDICVILVYLGGPLTALSFLIFETKNDFIRFHAYQAALLTTPLVFLRVLSSFMTSSWFQTFLTILAIFVQILMAIRAYRDASQNGLARYELPYIGPVADRWVGEE